MIKIVIALASIAYFVFSLKYLFRDKPSITTYIAKNFWMDDVYYSLDLCTGVYQFGNSTDSAFVAYFPPKKVFIKGSWTGTQEVEVISKETYLDKYVKCCDGFNYEKEKSRYRNV